MDFQPVLTKRFGRSHSFGSNTTRNFFGGKTFSARIYAPNGLTVLQATKRVNENIFSVKILAY